MPGDVFTAPPHALDRGGVDGARPGEPLGNAGTEVRIVRVDPGAVSAPDFIALQDAEDFRPFRRIAGVNADFLVVRERCFNSATPAASAEASGPTLTLVSHV